MERVRINPRHDYKKIIENVGFDFHQDYWLEDACYLFSTDEIALLEKASNECYRLYCEATEACLYDEHKLDLLKIPVPMRDFIRQSWEDDDLSLYGRFDFAFVDGVPKLLEFNADTPTTLIESSLVQWYWKEDVFPEADQFNSLHEALVRSWRDIHAQYGCERYFFASLRDCMEDYSTMAYIMSTAFEAGLNTAELDLRQIIIEESLLTPNREPIDCMFKLYPWETMFEENMGGCVTEMCWIEPLWKSLMSNKAMLPILYEMFPDSPYILPAYFEADRLSSYCRKPVFSREGCNVELIKNGFCIDRTNGDYGKEGYIYQQLVDLPDYGGKYPILGCWIIGGEACGMGIREHTSRITVDACTFVPHIFR